MTIPFFILAAIAFAAVTVHRFTDHRPGDHITYNRFFIHGASALVAIIAVILIIILFIIHITT